MIATITIVVLTLAAAVVMARAARGSAPRLAPGEDPAAHLVPVDLPSFMNLLDPGQQQFLRERLPSSEFRALARERNRVLLIYVRWIARNSAVFVRLGEAARTVAAENGTAKAAKELADVAIQTRLYALAAMAMLYLGVVFPSAPCLTGISGRYQSLVDRHRELHALART